MKKKRKRLNFILKILGIILIIFILFIVILFFNQYWPESDRTNYDKSCITDEDCIIKDIGGMCPWKVCINKEEVVEGKASTSKVGMIKPVTATSCRFPTVVACKCYENRCKDIDYEKPESSSDCIKIENIEFRDVCYKNSAEKLNNSDICKKINQSGKKKECFISLAIIKRDYKICYNIENSEDKNGCISLVAQVTRDLELCNQTTNKQQCLHIYYLENCEQLNNDINLSNVNYSEYFVLKVTDYSNHPYKCKSVEVIGECPPTSCGQAIRYNTDSTGRGLIKKSDILLGKIYKVDDNNAWMSHSRFNLENYDLKEISIKISVS